VLRCLAKDAAERFPDAEGLEHALGECACAGDWDRERAVRWWRDADAGDCQLSRPPGEGASGDACAPQGPGGREPERTGGIGRAGA
jgi:hypothetical protein